MIQATEILSNFSAKLQFGDLPQEVVEQTKMYVLDYIASALAGYKANADINTAILSLINDMGGSEQSSVLFSDRKYPASNAAFLNALYSNGADFDDGNRIAAGHIGSHVMSSVFATAETLSLSWEEVIVAINVGYEVFNRIAGAAQPGIYAKGFHATGIAGSVASAAAVAKLMGLSSNGIYKAISLGVLQASGLIIIDESGQACKPINPANAARTGVFSAQLAAKNVETPSKPLESKKGWFNAYSDKINEEVLLDGLGQKFTISESYLKLFPTCRHTHPVIEAAISIRKRMQNTGKSIKDIASVQITTYPSAIRSAGYITHPSKAEEARFSIHYSAAQALYSGGFNLNDLNVGEADSKLWDLVERIELISDNSMENRQSGIRGASLSVFMRDGTQEIERVDIPKGEAANPLSWEELSQKLDISALGLGIDAYLIAEKVCNLNTSNSFSIWTSWF